MLETWRPVFLVVTFVLLGLAFWLTYRPRARAAGGGRSKIMAMNKVMLPAVAVVAVALLFFPQYVSGLFAADDGFTPDMTRTVLSVEGMTCPGSKRHRVCWQSKWITSRNRPPSARREENPCPGKRSSPRWKRSVIAASSLNEIVAAGSANMVFSFCSRERTTAIARRDRRISDPK